MVDALPIGAALTTSEGRILRMNEMGMELLGLTLEQIGTVKVPDLYVHPNVDRFNLWDTAMQGKISKQNVLLRVGNKEVEFHVRSRIFGSNGHAVLASAFWERGNDE